MSRRWRLPALILLALATVITLKHSSFGKFHYHHDIAPIIYDHCSGCHHDGGPAPFPLVEYEDVRKRSSLIVDVIDRHIMPPWMPAPGCEHFEGEPELSFQEIEKLKTWIAQGMLNDTPRDPPPSWSDDWTLGKPDLVVTLPEPYVLAAEGRDVYRNFVLPLPLKERQYVRAVEFKPGGSRAIHHAFMFFDRSGESLRLDREDPLPGFPGLHVPPSAQAPAGHFLSWQPGKRALAEPPSMSWPLPQGSALVLQTHLKPTGKPEQVQPSVAFYFTSRPPTEFPVKIGLWSEEIVIPAGEREAVVRDSMTLPADVDLLRILPHAHFLARRIEAIAAMPDGTARCLLKIANWDFNWQGDYAYREPIRLSKGTVLSMLITYDNTADNARNPNQPPREVRYGVQSGDEMAELWMQVLPVSADGAALLEREMQPKVLKSGIAYNRYLLGLDPRNARARTELGKALYFSGKPNGAVDEFQEALRIRDDAEPHYFLGLIHRVANRLDAAAAEFIAAIRIQPGHAKAWGNLGLVQIERGELRGAEEALVKALQLDPDDEIARSTLDELRARKK